MAGGKETPRQKMIGMMYLVLTALLALNVTKEVVSAFVTINDKLDASAQIIHFKNQENYTELELKKLTLMARDADLTEFNLWSEKADELRALTGKTVGFLLGECNAMINEAEGKDWVAENGRDDEGNITALKPLGDIEVKDDYDIPTQLFVGANPKTPNNRGMMIREEIHAYRNTVCTLLANYQRGEKQWSFTPPTTPDGLGEALKSVNPEDTAQIGHLFRLLSLPEKLFDAGEEEEMPWSSVTFNHAPIVAAAAMFTSLKVDVKNGESVASQFILDKIKEPIVIFDRIEPMAFAQSNYINAGDSLELKVKVAAYNSAEVNTIRWGIDADTLPEKWQEQSGPIQLPGNVPGVHKVKGAVGIKERGALKWRPWEFDYTVGQPLGVIAQPNMRLLYRGYDNEIEAAASGFPPEKISISASSGCQVRRAGNKWVVKVTDNSVRNASITVRGQKEDGSWVNVATNSFVVKPMPRPEIFLGGISAGQRPGCSGVRAQRQIRLRYGDGIPLTGVNFMITEGKVTVDGKLKTGKVKRGGILDENALQVLSQSCGRRVTITAKYIDPTGITNTALPLVFTVR